MADFDLAAFSKAVADRAEAAAAHTASITLHRQHYASAFHWRDGLYVAAEELVDADAEVETVLPSGGLDGRFEGAAALDPEGALIGMVLFGPRRRALVIPAETIDRVAPVLASKGRVGRGYLGAGLHPVRDEHVRGAIVMRLDDGG